MSATPGPWFATRALISGRMVIRSAEGEVIATAGMTSRGTENDNAALLAAAPRLRDAVELAIGLLTDPEAEVADASRVEALLREALRGVTK